MVCMCARVYLCAYVYISIYMCVCVCECVCMHGVFQIISVSDASFVAEIVVYYMPAYMCVCAWNSCVHVCTNIHSA